MRSHDVLFKRKLRLCNHVVHVAGYILMPAVIPAVARGRAQEMI